MSNLGNLGDNKGQNTNIFLKCREGERLERWSLPAFIVSTWCSLSRFRTCRNAGSGPLVVCSPPFVRFAFGALLANMALFRILRGFLARFLLFRVGLYCLRALRGLWGFCAREWLGGLKACCVFALLFVLLLLCLPPFMLVVLLCSGCPRLVLFPAFALFVCLLVFVFSFSLSDYTQKERAQRFCSLRPLFVCCWLLYSVAALYSSNSSGLNPLIS